MAIAIALLLVLSQEDIERLRFADAAQLLQSNSTDVLKCTDAAILLGASQKYPDISIPALVHGLNRPKDYSVRLYSLRSLGAFLADHRAFDAICKHIKIEQDFAVADELYGALVRIGKKSIPCLIDELHQDNPARKTRAARALVAIRQEPQVIRRNLLKAYQNLEKGGVKNEIILTLIAIDPEFSGGDQDIIASIQSDEKETLGDPLATAEEFALAGKRAVPFVLPVFLKNIEAKNDWNVRFRSLVALSNLGPLAKPAVPALEKELNNAEEDDYQLVFAIAIANIDASKEASCRLVRENIEKVELWRDRGGRLGEMARWAISRCGSK